MLKIGSATPTANAVGEFTEGAPGAGVAATLIKAAWLNAVQRELVNTIEGLGVELDPDDDSQLLSAIQSLVSSNAEWGQVKHKPNSISALNHTAVLTQTTALTSEHMGLLVVDATATPCTLTLPLANAGLGAVEVLIRRKDATSNSLILAANGADKIMLDSVASPGGQSTTELLFPGDYLRLRADTEGHWLCVGQAPLPASIASGLVALTAVGAGTYTVPPVLRSGRRKAKVTVTGAGGSGGLTNNSPVRGGGGGAAGTAIKLIDLTAITSVSYTVGAGVTPGNGGASSFGAYCSASGGGQGLDTSGGGVAGTGVGGDINLVGGHGSDSGLNGGLGGGSYWGGGVRGGDGPGVPTTSGPGTGAGGAVSVRNAGANGIITVEW